MMDALHKCLLVCLLTCLGRHTLGSEIIHGSDAPQGSMLYMASLQNDSRNHVCGGFLINEKFVLTAAHCTEGLPTSVVLGTHNLETVDEKMRFRVKMCPHECYERAAFGKDIMLLKLLQKAPLKKNKRIKTIQLPKRTIQIEDKVPCQVAGWGATRTGGPAVDVLKTVEVFTVNLETCKELWKSGYVTLPANVTCAGGYETDKGICQGDSGGPLVCNGVALGIVSFNGNENCDYPQVPNIYTEISKYLHWIKKMQKKC